MGINIAVPQAVVPAVGAETYTTRAHVIEGAERERLYRQHADVHPEFKDYVSKTDRVIPVIALDRTAG
jgi:hypothetical protein